MTTAGWLSMLGLAIISIAIVRAEWRRYVARREWLSRFGLLLNCPRLPRESLRRWRTRLTESLATMPGSRRGLR